MRLSKAVAVLLCVSAAGAARPLSSHTSSIHAAASPCYAAGSSSDPAPAVWGSVISSHGRLSFVEGVPATYVAAGAYVDSNSTLSNFGKLRIKTAGAYEDLVQMRAAGFLEGWLTAAKIHDHWHNLDAYFRVTMNSSLEEPMIWLNQQQTWVMSQVDQRSHDPRNATAAAYWRTVGLALVQWEGLVQGYQARSKVDRSIPRLSRQELLFLHSNGDLYDIIDMFEAAKAADAVVAGGEAAEGKARPLLPSRLAAAKTPEQLFVEVALTGKCSALIKVLGDLSDIVIGHSTWDSYTSALRIFKHYEFSLNDPAIVPGASHFSFSSYPGELFSDDDLWMTGSKLVILETTNHIYNPLLFKALTPFSVLSWQRVRASNLLATGGEDWVRLFSEHQSGTYNNQMMVLDLSRFRPKQELEAGLLWVAEQLPGMIVAADMTQVLVRGYWPSYNVPFFPEVYNASGIGSLAEEAAESGPEYSQTARWLHYQSNPRANIMRRDQGDVAGVADMRRLMRHNTWASDPYSTHSPMGAICGRGDLLTKEFIPKGCQDSKVTSYEMALRLEADVVNGPTTQEGTLPVFDWDDPRWAAFEHRGHPRLFDFRFERMSAADLPLTSQECLAASRGAASA